VGCLLLYPDGTVQHRGVYVAYAEPYPICPFHAGRTRPPDPEERPAFLSAVTAACMLARRQALEEVGGFDESYRNGYEDVDMCFAMRERGWLIAYTPEARVIHFESQTPGRHKDFLANEDQLHRRWLGRFKAFDFDRRKAARRTFPDALRPRLSLIVPTCDSLAFIARCLEDAALNLATGDEIVVADSGSRDSTLNFVSLFGLEHPGLVRTLRTSPDDGLAGAIREGVRTAAHDLIVVLPGPATMSESFLDGIWTAAARSPAELAAVPLNGAVAVAGPARRVRAITDTHAAALLQGDASAVVRYAAGAGAGGGRARSLMSGLPRHGP
jgi:GT2 family glycosyltransferase